MLRIAFVTVLSMLAVVPVANAGTRSDIVKDCMDGRLDGSYTPSQIRDARNNLPDDIEQYADCSDVLALALGGTGDKRMPSNPTTTPGGPAIPAPATDPGAPLMPSGPEEQALLDSAARGEEPAPAVADEKRIASTAARFATDPNRNDLPTVVLAVLILAGAALLAATASFARRHVADHAPS